MSLVRVTKFSNMRFRLKLAVCWADSSKLTRRIEHREGVENEIDH